jgi:thiamine biosynthesis lipoprotein
MAKKSSPLSIYSFLALVSTAGLFFACIADQKHVRHFFALDTAIDVTVYSRSPRVEADMDSLATVVERLEALLSISKESSEIYRINHRNDSLIAVPVLLRPLLSLCAREFLLSSGLFDVTVEPLKYLYGLESHQTQNHVPLQKELVKALSLIGFGRVRFISDSVIAVPVGMKFDFGGIAKGCVLSETTDFLQKKGYRNFLINLGGDLKTCGKKPSGEPWVIGIQDPRSSDKLIATLSFAQGCVFTSGDYERFFLENGKRYHHLFNPKTGVPGSCNMSATVTGSDPLEVDAAVKTAFLMPAPQALDYLASRNMQGFIIDSAKTGWASLKLKQSLTAEPGFFINFK